MRTPRFLALPAALVGLIVALAVGAPALSGCDSGGSAACPTDVAFGFEDVTPDSVEVGSVVVGQGDCVSVAYVGRLADGGGVFAQGTDFRFVVPSTNILPTGFVLGMGNQREGETRIVTVPPNLGFGPFERGALFEGGVDIPACSVVEFEITLNRIFQDARSCS